MKNKCIVLAMALLATLGNNPAQSQTPSSGKSVPAAQQAAQAASSNTYVIRHHGLSNHRPDPNPFILSPSVPNAGPAEVATSDAFREQGEAEMKKGYLSAARNDYEQALSLWPESKNALYDAAECATAAGDYSRALTYYRAAIYSNNPSVYGTVPGDGFQENNVSRLMQFASVLSRAGQASEAMFVYNRTASLLDYQDSGSHGGKPYLKVLLPELAAVPTSPEQVPYTAERLQALADTALTHEEMGFGSNKEAIAHMKEAAKLYPDSAAVQYYLGEALSRSYYVFLDSSAKDKAATWTAYQEDKKATEAAYKKAAELGDDSTVAAAKERLAAPR